MEAELVNMIEMLNTCVLTVPSFCVSKSYKRGLGVTSKKTDIIQIIPIPSHPIFDKFIFDKVLLMLTSLPPLEFLIIQNWVLLFLAA